jgi:GTP pyrophosphokinase
MEFNESEFLNLCEKQKYSENDISLFKKAINFVKKTLGEKKRLTGELIITHNLAIGIFLSKIKYSPEIITSGLLYGLEKYVSEKIIDEKFNEEISEIVFGQIQLRVIRSKNKNNEAETIRKILIASLNNPKIILIKLASKLHNIMTIKVFSEKKQRIIAKEVLEIYSPLANRLGAEFIKKELEDYAFLVINKRKYNEIKNFVKGSKQERKEFIENFILKIKNLLGDKIIDIKGRKKHLYSLYKKITQRDYKLDKIKDIFAIRIIVSSIKDCYFALSILHENYNSVKDTFKDYIANPKPNGYQSIHTVIKYNNKDVEFQIRTHKMNDFAEEGAAAHWQYKKIKSDAFFEKKTALIKSLIELQKNEKDILKSVKIDIFGDKIYCYTPKGKSIELPKNSCVLDFAYSIHADIGNTAIGGRINGKYVSLKTKLKSSDVIEVITNKNQRPTKEWLKWIVLPRAKNHIRKNIKKHGKSVSIAKLNKEDKKEYGDLVFAPNFREYILSRCCCPIPDEEIVGVRKHDKSLLVHFKGCKKIINKKALIKVSWKNSFNRPIKIIVLSKFRSGILADVLYCITQEGFVVNSANVKLLDENTSKCFFTISPKKLKEISDLLKKISEIRSIKRIRVE